MRRFALTIVFLVVLLGVGTAHVTHAAPLGIRLAQESDSEGGDNNFDDDGGTATQIPASPANTSRPTTAAQPPVTNPPVVTTPTNTATSIATEAQPTPETASTQTTTTPTSTTPAAPNISTNFPWAWVVTRAAGILSYILLGLLSLTGMLLTTGTFFRAVSPATAWSIHRAIASTLLISVATHIGALLFDTFINLRIVDVLVPFVSPYRPLLIALGITGFYLLLLVLATSLYTMNRFPRFWRIVHYFSFVMFLSIFFHGLLIGTDAKVWWVRLVYWATAVLVVGLGVYRLWWKHHQDPTRTPRRA